MKVRFSPRARSDLEAIVSYLNEHSASGARNVLGHIRSTIQVIAEHPLAAERTDDPKVRVKIVSRYGYKVFYHVQTDTIFVLHVRHARRAPWLGR